MTARLFIFGLGYVAQRLATRARAAGWHVTGCRRRAGNDIFAFDDPAIFDELARATHILSSVPPERGTSTDSDPVLARYGAAIRTRSTAWVGYLSSTGVYGDCQGAWIDESTPVQRTGARDARFIADQAWGTQIPRPHIFRLPGIYGPGRSAITRLRQGSAQRIDAGDHVFSRIHVDDIVTALLSAMTTPAPGIFNLADDLPAPGSDVIAYASQLLGRVPPPLTPLDQADLSPFARGFYAAHRRVANGKAKRILGLRLRYQDYKAGLLACKIAEDQPGENR